MINSPCKQICKIDIKSGLCQGCNRNLDEIKNWFRLNDSEKIEILEKIKKRRELFLIHRN
tara:strand:- start:57 stop:236 length:180 start_codon:yes stop_codon:yes gene_type:complete